MEIPEINNIQLQAFRVDPSTDLVGRVHVPEENEELNPPVAEISDRVEIEKAENESYIQRSMSEKVLREKLQAYREAGLIDTEEMRNLLAIMVPASNVKTEESLDESLHMPEKTAAVALDRIA